MSSLSNSQNQTIGHILFNSTAGPSQTQYNSDLESLIIGWYGAIKLKSSLASCNVEVSHLCQDVMVFKDIVSAVSLNVQQLIFLRSLGIDEKLLMSTCSAQHTLGKNYLAWSSPNQDFMQIEGDYGLRFSKVQFHHFLPYLDSTELIYDDYAIAAQMARNGQFVHPVADKSSILSTFTYGLNVNTFRFTQLLIKYAKSIGVNAIDGSISNIVAHKGQVSSLSVAMKQGNLKEFKSDFYIDCSNQTSVLLTQFADDQFGFMNTQLSASRKISLLLVNRPSSALANTIRTHNFGWSKTSCLSQSALIECYCSVDTSIEEVVSSLSAEGIEVNQNGVREENLSQKIMRNSWLSNCLFVGKMTCDIEPFSHNCFDIVDEQLRHFMQVFPSTQFQANIVAFYNRSVCEQTLSLLDMNICHYQLSSGHSSVYWQKNLEVKGSENLAHLLSLFRQTGIFPEFENQYIIEDIWINFLVGFGCIPESTHPLSYNEEDVKDKIHSFKAYIQEFLKDLPPYDKYIASAK